VAAVENGSPSGYYRRSLIFEANGFTSEVRSYGIYPGQPRDELSGYWRTDGTYRVEDDRLVFQPTRIAWWDRFYGATSPEQIREPYPSESIFDDARYEMQGQQLILRFTIYPADAPEPAELVYTRVW
jgi:hypothetical protein